MFHIQGKNIFQNSDIFRVEFATIEHPIDNDKVIIYGGVFLNTTSFIFQSVGQIYSYSKRRHRFRLLHEQGKRI
jgi:hypothetical protein